MQIELEIREILASNMSVETKVDKITAIVNWNKKNLIDFLNKLKIGGTKGRTLVIEKFWGNDNEHKKKHTRQK